MGAKTGICGLYKSIACTPVYVQYLVWLWCGLLNSEDDMTYAQYRGGQKLHLVYEAGEGFANIVRAGFLSKPLCGKYGPNTYRMTINVPLAHACKNCQRVYTARHKN